MEKNFYTIYQKWLQKNHDVNKVFTIFAERFVTKLKISSIITLAEVELVNAEKTNEGKNNKLFLDVMPGKGAKGLTKLMEILEETDEHLLTSLRDLQGLCDIQQKMWGSIPTMNRCYVGRVSMTELIKSTFNKNSGPNKASTIVVVCGLGGVGKTQVVAEYVHKNEDGYNRVVWISSSASKLDANFVQLTRDVCGETSGRASEKVKCWFEKCSPCLIVFDDADNYNHIAKYLPKKGCDILVTSRYAEWPPSIVAECIELRVFSTEESTECIHKWLKTKIPKPDPTDVDDLGKVLGHLPLALVQACCYIRECSSNIGDYVKMFIDQKKQVKLLREQRLPEDMRNEENENTIMITWNITKDAIKERWTMASNLLTLCAYLQCDCIPEFLAKIGFFILNSSKLDSDFYLRKTTNYLLAMFYSLECHDEYFINFREVMTVLSNFSMLMPMNTERGDHMFSMHCLLQKVIRIQETDMVEIILISIMWLLHTAYDYPENQAVRKLKNVFLLPHILEHIQSMNSLSEEYPIVWDQRFTNWRQYLIRVAAEISLKMQLLVNAIYYYEDFLKIQLEMGSDSDEVAHTMSQIGMLSIVSGDYEKSEDYLQKALQMVEKTGAESLLLCTLQHLQDLYHCIGNRTKSIELLERINEIQSRNLQSYEQQVQNMCTLGTLMAMQGDENSAERMFESALNLFETALISNQLECSQSLESLAVGCLDIKNLKTRKRLLKRTLNIQRMKFGLGADTTFRIHIHEGLAMICIKLGNVIEAKDLLEEALLIKENFFGQDHPTTFSALFILGIALLLLEEFERGINVLEKALAIGETSFGSNSGVIAALNVELLSAYIKIGNNIKTKEIHQKVLNFYHNRIVGRYIDEDFKRFILQLADLDAAGLEQSGNQFRSSSISIADKRFVHEDLYWDVADKHHLFEYVFFEETAPQILLADVIEKNHQLQNIELRLLDQEITELKLMTVSQHLHNINVALDAMCKLLKWPKKCLLPALEIFRLSLLTAPIADHLFARQTYALDLLDMLCRLAADNTTERNQFRLVVCKIFANLVSFSSACNCVLSCAPEVIDVILSDCICSPDVYIQVAAASSLSNIILFVTVETAPAIDSRKKLAIANSLFHCLNDMHSTGFDSFDRLCLIYVLQSLYVILLSDDSRTIEELAKTCNVVDLIGKIRIALSKVDEDEHIMNFADQVLTLYQMCQTYFMLIANTNRKGKIIVENISRACAAVQVINAAAHRRYVAEEMGRNGQFEKKNFLTTQQIANFLSRAAAKRQNPLQMQEDTTADDNNYITNVDAVKDSAFQDDIEIEIKENFKESECFDES